MVGRQAEIGWRKRDNEDLEVDLENHSTKPPNGNCSDAPSSSWTDDLPSITLLLLLYTLQGIPMGLSGSIPFLLLDKVNTRDYGDHATPYPNLQP